MPVPFSTASSAMPAANRKVIPIFGEGRKPKQDPIALIHELLDAKNLTSEQRAELHARALRNDEATPIFSDPLRNSAAECRAASQRLLRTAAKMPAGVTPIFDERQMTIRGIQVDCRRLREEIRRSRASEESEETASRRESLRLYNELRALDAEMA